MENRCFHRNAIHIGSKRIGNGELQFNLEDYNLRGRVFPQHLLDDIQEDPMEVVAYGRDNAAHNVQMGVVFVPDRGRELQITNMNGMRQAYSWNFNTSISAYYYTSGTRGAGGAMSHKLVIAEQAGGSCKGCGVNI